MPTNGPSYNSHTYITHINKSKSPITGLFLFTKFGYMGAYKDMYIDTLNNNDDEHLRYLCDKYYNDEDSIFHLRDDEENLHLAYLF